MLGLETLENFTQWKSECAEDPKTLLNKDMLIIGMSSTASEDEQRRGFENGMHFFSPKPVELDSLKRAIEIKLCNRNNIEGCIDVIFSDLMMNSGRNSTFRDEIKSPRSAAVSPDADASRADASGDKQTEKAAEPPATVSPNPKTKPTTAKAFASWSFFKKTAKVSPV
jgi:CheY-like chemotaxis protein